MLFSFETVRIYDLFEISATGSGFDPETLGLIVVYMDGRWMIYIGLCHVEEWDTVHGAGVGP